MKLCYFYSIQGGGTEGREAGLITEDMYADEERANDLIVQASNVIYFPDAPAISGNPSSLLLNALLKTMPPDVKEAYKQIAGESLGTCPGPAVVHIEGKQVTPFRDGVDTALNAGELFVEIRPAICHILPFPEWPPIMPGDQELLAAVQGRWTYSYAIAHFVEGFETLDSLGYGGPPLTNFAREEDANHSRNADRILSLLNESDDDE